MSKLKKSLNMLLMFSLAHSIVEAQQVKKWVDKDGKTHYGDTISAPQKSEAVQLTDNRGTYKYDVPKQTSVIKKIVPDVKKNDAEIDPKVNIPVAAVNQCIAYAKGIAAIPVVGGKRAGDGESEVSSLVLKIRRTCPNVEISCTIGGYFPENDRCEAMVPRSKNMVFTGMVNKVWIQISSDR